MRLSLHMQSARDRDVARRCGEDQIMYRLMIVTTVAAIAAASGSIAQTAPPSGSPSTTALSPTQCEGLWKQAQAGKTGDLDIDRAMSFVSDFKVVDKDNNGKLTETEWSEGCKLGHVKSAAANAASKGARIPAERHPIGRRANLLSASLAPPTRALRAPRKPKVPRGRRTALPPSSYFEPGSILPGSSTDARADMRQLSSRLAAARKRFS